MNTVHKSIKWWTFSPIAPGVRGAGKWGDERGGCDIPLRTLENLFEHLGSIKDQV